MKGSEYTCAVCRQTFLMARPHGEALAEAEERYGPIPEDQREILCEDCHGEYLKWFESLTPAEHKEIQRTVGGGR